MTRPRESWLGHVAVLALVGACHRPARLEDPPREGSVRTATSALGWHYTIGVDPALDHLDGRVCFDGPAPASIEVSEGWAESYLAGPPVRDGACFGYRVALGQAAEEEDSWSHAKRVGRDLLLSPDLWLLGPEERPESARVTARFELPSGLALSVPWRTVSDGGGSSTRGGRTDEYEITAGTWRWRSLMAITVAHEGATSARSSDRPERAASFMAVGRSTPAEVAVPGGVLEVTRLDRPVRASDAGILRWLGEAGRAVSLVSGRLPVPRIQVLVLPVPGDEDPVEFGMALRGGGPAAMFFLADGARDAELPGEWVSVHELSHHLLPFVERGSSWLSEGFATYYQNVLRARAGLLSPEDAWRKTLEGFERGRAESGGATLAEVSADMDRNHRFMRVYWSGAAIALLADVQLRRRGQSLDRAVASLADCCLRDQREWPAEEVLQRMDRAVGGRVLEDTAAAWVEARDFPAVEETCRALGLRLDGGRVHFDDQAPIADVRRAIVGASTRAASAP